MDRLTQCWSRATRMGLLLALALVLVGCVDLSGQEEETSTFDSPLVTPTAGPGVIIITPGEDRIEPTWTPWPTATPRPTPTRKPGPTATPFPIRGPTAGASGTILYTVADQSKSGETVWSTYALPVDEQGRKRAEAMPQSFSLDFSPIINSASPDGRYLLLLQSAEAGGIPYVFDWENKQVWPLLKKHPQIRGLPFGWHPDSRQVLFWTDLTLEAGLWLADVETGEHTVLALLDYGPVQGATISPDGQRIAYVYSSDSSNRAMWLVSAAGGDSRLLFDIGGPTRLFSWSPDGANLLYAGGGVGFKEAMAGTPTPGSPLRLVEADGRNIHSLNAPFIFGWGFKPVWSPDGRYIALVGSNPNEAYGCAGKFPPGEGPDWQTCRFQGTSIYIEDVLTGETRRLVSGIEPVWSPDGSMIAFLSNQSGSSEIWAINVDGTDLHQLTDDGQSKETFIWFQGR